MSNRLRSILFELLKHLLRQQFDIPIREGAANIYTETARIWNPIHSDKAFALAAGLPDIILHGTATLALGISALVNEFLHGDSRRVRRLGGRFCGMVLMPNTLTVAVNRRSDELIGFNILDANDQLKTIIELLEND